MNNNDRKLNFPDGLCTSIACDDEENASRIKIILDNYLQGQPLQVAGRNSEDWQPLESLPMVFDSLRYRIAR